MIRVVSRRELLRAALLAPLPRPARARSVLVVFTPGGMSQLETWDPKPSAPAEVRGAFRSIATAVPGVRFGEHLPPPVLARCLHTQHEQPVGGPVAVVIGSLAWNQEIGPVPFLGGRLALVLNAVRVPKCLDRVAKRVADA